MHFGTILNPLITRYAYVRLLVDKLYTKLYATVKKIMARIADLDRQCSEAELVQRLTNYITKATDFDSKAI